MIAFLPETDQRRLGILRLLSHQSKWLTVQEIAAQIGASERTIQSDLNYMKNEWDPMLGIDVSQKNGVRLYCHSSAVLHAATISVFQRSIAVQFLYELMLHPNQEFEFYLSKLFVSYSTLARTLPKIKSHLAEAGVYIQRTGTLYRLGSANELLLRKLLAEFYVELSPGNSDFHAQPYELLLPGASLPVDRALLFPIIERYIRQYGTPERADFLCRDGAILTLIASFLVISLLREYQGFHAVAPRSPFNDVSEEDFCLLKRMFPDLERRHLEPILTLLEQILLVPQHAKEAVLLQRATTLFYQQLFGTLHLTCKPETQKELQLVLSILYSYRKAFPAAMEDFPKRHHFFTASLEASNPGLYRTIQTALSEFSSLMNVDMAPVFSDLVGKLCFCFPGIARATIQKRVLVVSDAGRLHAEFLAGYFSSLLNGDGVSTIDVYVMDLEGFLSPSFRQQSRSYDVLVTTLLALPHLEYAPTVVQVEDLPSAENIRALFEAVYER